MSGLDEIAALSRPGVRPRKLSPSKQVQAVLLEGINEIPSLFRCISDIPDMKTILSIVLLLVTLPAEALELFGVELQSTNRDELRNAVKSAGVVLIREAGDETGFDVYDSAAVMAGSSRLYLGFVKADQRFAFAEYEFPGLDASGLLQSLGAKYGEAESRTGRFLSDRSYFWQRDGIEIRLRSDWQNYAVRLSYVHPQNLDQLRREHGGQVLDDGERPEFSTF